MGECVLDIEYRCSLHIMVGWRGFNFLNKIDFTALISYEYETNGEYMRNKVL